MSSGPDINGGNAAPMIHNPSMDESDGRVHYMVTAQAAMDIMHADQEARGLQPRILRAGERPDVAVQAAMQNGAMILSHPDVLA